MKVKVVGIMMIAIVCMQMVAGYQNTASKYKFLQSKTDEQMNSLKSKLNMAQTSSSSKEDDLTGDVTISFDTSAGADAAPAVVSDFETETSAIQGAQMAISSFADAMAKGVPDILAKGA